MRSKKHNSDLKSIQQIVEETEEEPPLRPHCGIFVSPNRIEVMIRLEGTGSGGHVVIQAPWKNGQLPIVHGQKGAPLPIFVSLEEAARLCGFSRKTLHNWIETGKLRKEHGLRKFGGQYRIEWSVFTAAIERGEVGSCSSKQIAARS